MWRSRRGMTSAYKWKLQGCFTCISCGHASKPFSWWFQEIRWTGLPPLSYMLQIHLRKVWFKVVPAPHKCQSWVILWVLPWVIITQECMALVLKNSRCLTGAFLMMLCTTAYKESFSMKSRCFYYIQQILYSFYCRLLAFDDGYAEVPDKPIGHNID